MSIEGESQVVAANTAVEPAQHLDSSACWALLRAAEVGRLAVIVEGRPQILPVNHAVDHGSVVFRTAEGTVLAGASSNQYVAFEVDGLDTEAGEAWSVVVKGRAVQMTLMHDVLSTLDLPLFPWQASPKHRFVRLVPDEVTGRRFSVVAPTRWQQSLLAARHAAVE